MSGSRSLRERIAGQSAMSDVVLAQRSAPERSQAARFFGVSPLTPESRSAYTGALGELLVGDILDNLGPSWDILHDLPLGDTLLDHLVIGPAGVFAIHVTNALDRDVVVDGDALFISGEPQGDILDAKHGAEAAAQALSDAAGSQIRVRPLLVVVEPRRLSVRVPAAAVRVIPSYQLDRVLDRAPRTLDGASVAAISDVADLAATWPAAVDCPLDIPHLHRDFALVRAEVRGALVRRVIWGTLGIAVLYCSVWALIASLVSAVIAS